MFKLLIALTCVAAVSAYGDCPACAASAGPSSTSCGCNSCTEAANSFRILDCSLNACGDRRLAETTDLEEAAPATAQWGRRRRRFFDYRRRRRRFFDYRRRRRRTPYPTPFPTPYPTPYENFHCEKVGSGCRCACHKTLKCALRHHHTS